MKKSISNPLCIREIKLPNSKAKLLVAVMPDGCWLCINRAIDKDGYARILYNGKNTRVHKMMYLLFKGEIPPDYVVRHKCRPKNCCNPAHLNIGTDLDNANDR